MDDDQSLLFDVDDDVKPLPQSLPEKTVTLSYPSIPMPSTKPPSPPRTTSAYQNQNVTSLPFKNNFKKRRQKAQRKKYCMDVPRFFRTMMNPNSQSSIYHSSYISASREEDEEDSESLGYSSVVEEDYGDIHSSQLYRNPNRGLGNSAQGDGTTIPELVFRLRILHWILCLFGVTTQFYAWLGNALTLRPARVVLGAYNLFFFLIISVLELHISWINSFLRIHFGFLFTTPGRCVLLFLMTSLSIGQGSAPLALVGFFCFALAFYTITILCKYPAIDVAFANEGVQETTTIKTKVTKYAWSSLSVPEERASLLSSLTKTYI